ncbi:MAG TPA: hypothetical protein VG722_01800, partial [Tepidisphaeraceae bacterium]|nr:hypothetical protein [Tepidisphaeraceae bacterium]
LTLKRRAASISKVRAMAEKQNIRVSINHCAVFDDYGHSASSMAAHDWPWAVDITGHTAVGYRCFLHEKVRTAIANELIVLASSGVESIFLDDEVRHDWHPAATRPEGAHFCFCRRHLHAFGQLLGERISREHLAELLQSTSQSARRIRQAWLEFKASCLLDFIHFCEQAVHQRYPAARLGQMTTFSHFQMLGGLDFRSQVDAWAGALRPLCRPAQGWYGDADRTGIVPGLAQTLYTIQQISPETEIYSEVDAGGPWTQLGNSSRMVADFQIKANLALNIKTHSLLLEGEGTEDLLQRQRLIAALKRNRATFERMADMLPPDARRTGIQFITAHNLCEIHPIQCRGPIGDAADPVGITGAGLGLPPWPKAFSTLARIGIPLTLDDAPVAILTGGIAPALGAEALNELLDSKNLIIDAGAARDLARLGLLSRFAISLQSPFKFSLNERLCKHSANGAYVTEDLSIALTLPPPKIARFQTLRGSRLRHEIISKLIDADHHDRGIGIVGVHGSTRQRRACFLPYDLSESQVWGYSVRKLQWRWMLQFLAPDEPLFWVDAAFDVWPIVYRRADDPRIWIGLINFGHDPLEPNSVTEYFNGNQCTVKTIDDNPISVGGLSADLFEISRRTFDGYAVEGSRHP